MCDSARCVAVFAIRVVEREVNLGVAADKCGVCSYFRREQRIIWVRLAHIKYGFVFLDYNVIAFVLFKIKQRFIGITF